MERAPREDRTKSAEAYAQELVSRFARNGRSISDEIDHQIVAGYPAESFKYSGEVIVDSFNGSSGRIPYEAKWTVMKVERILYICRLESKPGEYDEYVRVLGGFCDSIRSD